MAQGEARIRQVIARLKPGAACVFAWARGHTALFLSIVLCVSGALWLLEHDARRKQQWEFDRLRRETSAEVAVLRARAASAMEEFRSNARIIHDLEARRASLEREALALRRRLNSLREEERLRARPAETLGPTDGSGRVAAQRGPQDFGNRESGIGNRGAGLGVRGGADLARFDMSAPAGESDAPDTRHLTPDTSLASCRELSVAQDELIANCEDRVEASQAVIDALNRSVQDLQQVVRAKDHIAQRIDAQHRAELKAARGSRLRKFGRAMQYVGVGVVIGLGLAR
jgi:hypothetical protein